MPYPRGTLRYPGVALQSTEWLQEYGLRGIPSHAKNQTEILRDIANALLVNTAFNELKKIMRL